MAAHGLDLPEQQQSDAQRLTHKLQQLGCPVSDLSECLCPGNERVRVVLYVLQTLVHPVPLEQLLARMDTEDATLQHLAPDERSAYKHAALLNSVGLQATPDQVRGSTSYQDGLSFLLNLTNTLAMQQDLRAAARAAGGGSPGARGGPPPCPAAHHSSARLLEYVCDHMPALVADNTPLFPTDITRACQPHNDQAAALLRNQTDLAAALEQGIEELQGNVNSLSQQVSQSTDQEWSSAHQECISATSHFMAELNTFLNVYHKELAVWCEASRRPETHGFGQQADAMLEVHARLSDLLGSVATVRRMHAAITTSAPPLQGYSRQDMMQLVAQGQQEATRLAQEVAVLTKACGRMGLGAAHKTSRPQVA